MFNNYNIAFRSIINSCMYSDYKLKAVDLLMVNRDPDYYKSVIKIMNSSMSSVYKLRAINTLNSKFGE